MTLPGRILLRQRVLEGRALGQGEMLGVFDAQFPAQRHQLQQGTVGILGVGQHIVVQHQVIAGTVSHQHITLSVCDGAPGGTDQCGGGEGGGVVHLSAGLYDLKIVKPSAQKQDQRQDQGQHDHRAETGYSFHVSPPILPMETKMG